jgi:hypothetical protein
MATSIREMLADNRARDTARNEVPTCESMLVISPDQDMDGELVPA